jgi:hypothetical protein
MVIAKPPGWAAEAIVAAGWCGAICIYRLRLLRRGRLAIMVLPICGNCLTLQHHIWYTIRVLAEHPIGLPPASTVTTMYEEASVEESRPMIHIRLPKALIKQVDHVAVDLDKDRAKTIEQLLAIALERVDDSIAVRPVERMAVVSR